MKAIAAVGMKKSAGVFAVLALVLVLFTVCFKVTFVTFGKLDCHEWDVAKNPEPAPALADYYVISAEPSSTEDKDKRRESFSEIFARKLWGGQAPVVNASEAIIGSGPGSTLESSAAVRRTLDKVIAQVKARLGKSKIRMLDIPCGDLTWMSEFMKDRTDVEYYGMDIVAAIIQNHQKVYTPNYPHMNFIRQDIVAEPLQMPYDLIHTREMTQHLTSADTLKVLKHFIESGSHFLMATTVPIPFNHELKFGRARHRLQNMEIAPYSLPPPICWSHDVKLEFNAVWRIR